MALAAAAALVLGCGDDGDTPPADAPTPATTTAPTPAPTPTATATPAGEEQEGGGGDEEAARVPVALTIDAAGVTPAEVSVPAFLALELHVNNELTRAVRVIVEGGEPPRLLVVPAQSSGSLRMPGRRKGRYTIDAGDAGHAVLVSGAEPGP